MYRNSNGRSEILVCGWGKLMSLAVLKLTDLRFLKVILTLKKFHQPVPFDYEAFIWF